MPSMEDSFQRLKKAVLSKRPILKEIITKRGTKNLFDYAQDYIDVNLVPPIQKRSDELIATFEREVSKRLGTETARSAAEQLKKYYYVSTADHHGPTCHPFFLNCNLIESAPLFSQQDPVLRNIIVLSCSNISFDNSSFPRGLFFHGHKDGLLTKHEIPLFPRSVRPCPVYKFQGYSVEAITNIRKLTKDKLREGNITQKHFDALNTLVEEVYASPEVLSVNTFSDQVTMTNNKLWRRFFNGGADLNGQVPPNFITLEQESFVNELLMDYHLDSDTTITHILFDPAYDLLLAQYFDGISGGFSLKERKGTYLFWGLPEGSKYRLQMWKEGNELVSADGSFRVY